MSEFFTGDVVSHERYGDGRIVATEDLFYRVDFGNKGIVEISKRSDALRAGINRTDDTEQDVMNALKKLLDQYLGISYPVKMGDRWTGGKMVLHPGKAGLQTKEIPMETFFHKIVMVRDRLRVLEQQINSHPVLSDEDKVNLQQYITRSYGSLTTFNVLFAEAEDQFKGSGKE